MRHRLVSSLAALLLFSAGCGRAAETPAPGPGPAAQPPPTPRSAILVSWDGVDRSVLKELLKDKRLPNLAKLIAAGSLQDIAVKGHETETRPGHAEMLTGLGPDRTGVRANQDPDPVPQGLSVFERLKKRHGAEGIATVMITGKRYVGTLFANAGRAIDTADVDSRLAADSGPPCLAALRKHKAQRFFAFLHFTDPDSAGHLYGSGSGKYRAAIETCDRWLGEIVSCLEKEKIRGSVRIYVMADHGFDRNARMHTSAPDSWLATDDREVKRGGTLADVPATILERLGVEIGKLEPPLVGRSLTAPEPAGKDPGGEPAPAPSRAPEPAVR